MANDDMVTLTFQLEDSLKKKFDKLCDSEHRSMAGMIRYLIEKSVDEEDSK